MPKDVNERILNKAGMAGEGDGVKSLMLDCFRAAIDAVSPEVLLRKQLKTLPLKRMRIESANLELNLAKFDKILVVGAGKASGAMAQSLEAFIGAELISGGIVNVPKGTSKNFSPKKILLNEASHPIPDENGVRGARRAVELLKSAGRKTLVFCLISGGGSALMSLPAEGLSLDDKIRTTELLLKSGASIEKVNCVRKHLSGIKGGQLVGHAKGARIISLIISDIVNNPIQSIASGPTAPDSTTFEEALEILREYELLNTVPKRVKARLERGAKGGLPETPKPGDALFRRVDNVIVGDNKIACAAMLGLFKLRVRTGRVYYLGSSWEGEAREVGENFASLSMELGKRISEGDHPSVPCAVIWGGESTVTVRGEGKGGRNQEQALAALGKLDGIKRIMMGFLATDGIDGLSEDAGAIIDQSTYVRARKRGLNLEHYLENNDSNTFFKRVGGCLIRTGPTGTNVNDVGLSIIG